MKESIYFSYVWTLTQSTLLFSGKNKTINDYTEQWKWKTNEKKTTIWNPFSVFFH